MIVQQGSINTTALVVPDLYVQIVPPQNLVLNGVPTNILGVVGTAQWGPVGVPSIVSTASSYVQQFGNIQNRAYDMGTNVFTAIQQGAANFRCVRVTDGTDVAATVIVQTTCITFSSRYTGTYGNSTTVTIATGSAAASFKVIVAMPNQVPEVFDNLTGTGNALWLAMAAAINTGAGQPRGPSQLITAVAGVGTTAPTLATVTLAAGTDGVATITPSVLVGSDVLPRTGMYSLRNQSVSVAFLSTNPADTATSYATFTTQASFGLSEGIYFILVGPSGDTIANAVTIKASSAVDNYSEKLMFGDWIWWNDPTNNVLRLVSPQGFQAGRLSNLSPEQSPLNKPIYGIVGSQKSGVPGSSQFQTYAQADLQTLFAVGIDVLSNPQPGGTYWGSRLGHNSSSNGAISGDNYTRMTNYIASTINIGMGLYEGQLITPTLFKRVKATMTSFFNNMLQQGLLGLNAQDGSLPFQIVCDASNNPFSRTSQGYLQCDVAVTYQAIVEKFIINVQGGQTVTFTKTTNPAGQVG